MQQSFPLTALVTGASGFIGGHLAQRLLRDGWRVKLLLRNPMKIVDDLKNTEIIEGDLANTHALKQAVTDVSVIFHCAAKVDSWGRREDYFETNFTGTKNLLQDIAENNQSLRRLVHISTVDVYGFPKNSCDENSPIIQTGFAYGDSKGAGEIYLRDFCVEHDIPYTIFRPCNVIGPGSQFIERIGKELQGGLMLTVDKGGANAGILYIDTLINYMLWAAAAPEAVSQCYNVRESYDVTWSQFISRFRKSLNSRSPVINLPFALADNASRACVLFYRIFMPSKEPLIHPLIIRIFGITCGHDAGKIHAACPSETISFNEAMRRSVEWFLKERT